MVAAVLEAIPYLAASVEDRMVALEEAAMVRCLCVHFVHTYFLVLLERKSLGATFCSSCLMLHVGAGGGCHGEVPLWDMINKMDESHNATFSGY